MKLNCVAISGPDVKSMLRDFDGHVTRKFHDTLSSVAASMVPQHDRTEERLKDLEIEVLAFKAASAHMRAPPGYSRLPSLNLRGAYASGGACGAGHGPECG